MLLLALQLLSAAYFSVGILGSLLPLLPLPTQALFSSLSAYGRLLVVPTTPNKHLMLPHWLLASILSWRTAKSHAFILFYILGSTVCAAAIWFAVVHHHASAFTLFILALFQTQALRRLYECLFVHTFSRTAQMPLHLVVFGAWHYLCVPWALFPSGCIGAAEDVRAVSISAPLSLATSANVAAGFTLFALGTALQAATHRVLAWIPKGESEGGGGVTTTARKPTYPLPTPHLSRVFKVSMCPHYTGEIMVYAGLAVLRYGTLGEEDGVFRCPPPLDSLAINWATYALPALMVGWVTCNLVSTGVRLKTWYASAYPGKGVERWSVVIPGLV